MAIEPKPVSTQEFNDRIARFGSSTAQLLKMAIRGLTSKGKGELVKSLRLKTKKYYGEIDRLTYRFLRHGVFFHKGVGRGYIMMGGSVIRGRKNSTVLKSGSLGSSASSSPKVLRGGMNRKPAEWFNPTLDVRVPVLADMVAEMRADQAVRATKMA